MTDLSVLIAARNEEFLGQTIEDVLKNRRASTEVIVVLDGGLPVHPIPQHPDVTVIYQPVSIGQRAAINLAAKVSNAAYVMKLDAHCSVAEGFDTVLIEAAKELGPAVVQIPAQKNLHVYDMVCDACQRREYQGPQNRSCTACGWSMHREMVWKPRRGTTTTSWRLDSELHFNYWGDDPSKETGGEIRDVMTSLGACLFLSREYFWKLGGLDEDVGSWGQFGQEIACKAWLSGGRQVVNAKTWFAHFFRVGGIGFPYEIRGSDQEYARQYSRNLWRGNNWPGQTKPLRWLIDKFWPVPGWSEEQRDALPASLGSALVAVPAHPVSARTAGIVYYSDCRGDQEILEAVRANLSGMNLPIVSVTLSSIDWPDATRIVLYQERGYLTMFRQILEGLEAIDTDTVFFCEHDVLYNASHFQFTPLRDDVYYYNQNVWKVDADSGKALHYRCSQTSGLCANRQLLLEHYRTRVQIVEEKGFSRAMGFEPGTHNRPERVDDFKAETWMSEFPNVDIRHGHNLTPSRWKKEQFRNQKYTEGWTEAEAIPGWGTTQGRFRDWLREVTGAVQQAVA